AALMYFYSRKLYPVPYEFRRVARALLPALALWASHYFTDGFFAGMPYAAFAARLLLLALYLPLLHVCGFFTSSELQKLRKNCAD
ncbi:MAG: hypothetical protein PHP45_10570, partial [Elusimicrobiales bacterium]|nr:hypothetical protein [Elusimicrobiales bacterium]